MWHRPLKSECIRPATPLSLEDAQRVVRKFVAVYNTQRLQTPQGKLEGCELTTFAERTRKLAEAREARARWRLPVRSEGLLEHLLNASQSGAAYAV